MNIHLVHKKTKRSRKQPGYFLGFALFLAGIYILLAYFNIIPSPESSFQFGRIAVLPVGILFAFVGAYIILYNKLKFKLSPIWSNLFVLACLLLLLVPFHIVYFQGHDSIMLLVLVVFDLVAVLLLGSLIYQLFAKAK
jgi:hypothetical protein